MMNLSRRRITKVAVTAVSGNGNIPPPFLCFFSCESSIHSQSGRSVGATGRFSDLKGVDDAINKFNLMLQTRPLPSIIEFTELLTSLARRKHYSTALSLFAKLDLLGADTIRPNLITLSLAINCFCRLYRVDLGCSVLGRILKLGYTPDNVTFTTLINGFCKTGRTSEAISLLRNMGRTKPNIMTYSTIIDSLCKDQKIEEAIKMLREMVGMGFSPDVVTYNILINGCCKDKSIDLAMTLFEQMAKKQVFPDKVTYTALIGGLCQARRTGDALLLLDKMKGQSLFPDQFTYSTLLDGLCKNQQLDEALRIFEQLENEKLKPNIIMYSVVLDGLCKGGRLDAARELFSNLSAKGLKPNVRTYSIMLDGYCKEGLFDEANELLSKMEENGLPDYISYSTIADAYLRNNETLKAVKVLERMCNRGIAVRPGTIKNSFDKLDTTGLDKTSMEVLKKFLGITPYLPVP